MKERSRENCDYRERCGKTGHFMNGEGLMERCECLKREIWEKTLGTLYSPNPPTKSKLTDLTDQNLIIEADLNTVRKHTTRALLEHLERGKTFRILDAYRLIEIFLEKDQEFGSTTESIDIDLLVLLLGFGDPRNRYLPELIIQALSRRDLTRRPTWIILGIPHPQITSKYSGELAEKLEKYRRVKT